jgi:hypothetical protein
MAAAEQQEAAEVESRFGKAHREGWFLNETEMPSLSLKQT